MTTQVADILIKKYALCHPKIVCPIPYWKSMPYALQTDLVTANNWKMYALIESMP